MIFGWLIRLFGGGKKASPAVETKPAPQTQAAKHVPQIDDRSARNIATLVPKAQEAARRWLMACLEAGLPVKIISGTRTYAEQDALYAKGRTAPGKVVTNARAGYSNHNFGIAWDFGVFGPKGEYITDGPVYTRAGEIAEAQGLEWGGSWTGFVDRPHIQLKTGLTLAQMRARVAAGKVVV